MTSNTELMNKERRFARCGIALGIAALLSVHATQTLGAEKIALNHVKGKQLTAHYGDQLLWQFHFDPDQPKPFFHPVSAVGGGVLTWNSPPDHIWHHGLWFSWKYINRLNYWEPDRKTGKPAGRTEWSDVQIATNPQGQAVIQMQLTYRPNDGEPVLIEDRKVVIAPPREDGSYYFDWTCSFTATDKEVILDRTPLPDEPGGEVYGGYAGLSIRMAKDLADREAITEQGPIEFSPQSRYRGKANVMEYAGTLDGQEIGITICDHPQNLNHPSPWYAIRSQVMSYYSPAVICYAPHTMKPSENITLRYRALIHPEKWTAARLTREYQQYVAESE